MIEAFITACSEFSEVAPLDASNASNTCKYKATLKAISDESGVMPHIEAYKAKILAYAYWGETGLQAVLAARRQGRTRRFREIRPSAIGA